MYKTLGKVLSEIYGQNEVQRLESSSDGYGSFDRLAELDNELVRFAAQVPEPLKWSNGTKETHDRPFLAQQRNVLHARYLHLLILLYRPTFTQFCRAHCLSDQLSETLDSAQGLPEMTPADSFAHSTSIRCAKRAIDLIMLIYRSAATDATGAWWYNMFYTRSSAMVIFMAMVCPLVRDVVGHMALSSAWDHCQSILLDKLPQSLTVQKCLQTLKVLHEHICIFTAKRSGDNVAEPSHGVNMHHPRTPNSAFSHMEQGRLDSYWEGLFDQTAFNFAFDEFGASLL
jgi:hypothetical protein